MRRLREGVWRLNPPAGHGKAGSACVGFIAFNPVLAADTVASQRSRAPLREVFTIWNKAETMEAREAISVIQNDGKSHLRGLAGDPEPPPLGSLLFLDR